MIASRTSIVVLRSLVVFISCSLLAADDPSGRPHITPTGEDITFDGNTSDNRLQCQGSDPVAWIFARNISAPLVQIPDNEDGSQRTLVIDTTGDDQQRLVGFYYCYYESAIESNIPTKQDLDALLTNNQASRIYVYVEITDPNQKKVIQTDSVIQAVMGSTMIIPCLPTSKNNNVQLQSAYGDKPKRPYQEYIGYEMVAAKKTCLSYNCKINGTTQRTIHIDCKKAPSRPTPPTINSTDYGYGEEGQDLELICWTPESVQTLEWILPSKLAKERYETTKDYIGGVNQKLIVKDLNSETDQGKYVCRASNGGEHVTNTTISVSVVERNGCQIDIWEAANMYVIVVNSTGTKQWYVNYRGYPKPTAEWRLPNKNILTDSDQVSAENHNEKPGDTKLVTILSIVDAKLQEAGVYELFVSNEYCSKSQNFTLIVLEAPTIFLKNYTFVSGEKSDIVFSISGHPASNVTCSFSVCKLVPGTNWPSEEEPINECNEPQNIEVYLTHNADKYIQNAIIPFAYNLPGKLTCEAINSHGDGQESAYIFVKDIEENLTVKTTPTEIVDGDTTQIVCSASMYDFTSFGVLKRSDGQNINSDNEADTLGISTFYKTLTFSNISKDDAGEYSCTVESHDKQIHTEKITIEVIDSLKPNFDSESKKYEERTLQLSDRIELPCQPSGKPTPVVKWLHNNVPVLSDWRVVANQTHLYIDRPIESDFGEYVCYATNRLGEASMVYNVKMDLGGMSTWAVIVLVVLLVVLSIACVVLVIFYRREHKKRLQLKHAGISYFVEGNQDSWDPAKSFMEQADLLPYDVSLDFPLRNLTMGIRLGHGAFGEVHMADAVGLVDGEPITKVAVKQVKSPPKDEDIKALITELKVMIHIRKHINIVNIVGVVRENIKNRKLLVMTEYCEFGNLYDFVRKNRKYFVNQVDKSGQIDISIQTIQEQLADAPTRASHLSYLSNGNGTGHDSKAPLLSNGNMDSQQTALNTDQSIRTGAYIEQSAQTITTTDLVSWSFQVTQGMHYLSTRHVLHGDLAARNVLLCRNGVVKICDFGLSRKMDNNVNYIKESTGLLPIKWLAIESITQKTYNTSTDVWSFGVFMWELFSLSSLPYPDISSSDLLRRLQDGYRMAQPQYATQDIYDIMLACWRLSPPRRPTFTQLSDMLSKHMPDDLKQDVLDKNSVYLEATNDNYLPTLSVPTINSPTEYAPRVPSTSIDMEEMVPMITLARTDSDTDLDTNNGPPKHAAPSVPVTVTPRTSHPYQNSYENVPKVPTPRKNEAVSNPGYIAVYNKK